MVSRGRPTENFPGRAQSVVSLSGHAELMASWYMLLLLYKWYDVLRLRPKSLTPLSCLRLFSFHLRLVAFLPVVDACIANSYLHSHSGLYVKGRFTFDFDFRVRCCSGFCVVYSFPHVPFTRIVMSYTEGDNSNDLSKFPSLSSVPVESERKGVNKFGETEQVPVFDARPS